MAKIRISKNILNFLVVFSLLFAGLAQSFVYPKVEAQTSAEIADEIEKKAKELEGLKAELSKLQNQTNYLASKKTGVAGSIEDIQNEIAKIENEIQINDIKIKELDKEKEIKQLEISTRRKNLNDKLHQFYIVTQQVNNSTVLDNTTMNTKWMDEFYSKAVIDKEKTKIDDLSNEVLGIANDIKEFESTQSDYSAQNEELSVQKASLEVELANIQYSLNSSKSKLSGVNSSIGSFQSDIEYLKGEQKRLLEEEAARMKGLGAIETYDVGNGEYYFSGNERDLYNGHYVGMMQWGAHDMAKAGSSYTQILTKFYTGVTVGGNYSSSSINVVGYGTMNIETYVAGIGEVPDKACGTAAQAAANPSKYIADNPNTSWDCWPEESIKAQIVAARSYALHKGGTICTTAACQVYDGTVDKQWAADETKGQVVLYNGGIANTLYSAAACGATMDNEDAFWAYSGGGWTTGTPMPYLRSVTYTETSGTYCNWNWNSKGYTKDQLTSIFSTLGYGIGTFQSISYEKMGNSDRVRWVTLNGSSGSKKLPGWLFKSDWNDFVWNREGGACYSTGHSCDFIYGVKFQLFQK